MVGGKIKQCLNLKAFMKQQRKNKRTSTVYEGRDYGTMSKYYRLSKRVTAEKEGGIFTAFKMLIRAH